MCYLFGNSYNKDENSRKGRKEGEKPQFNMGVPAATSHTRGENNINPKSPHAQKQPRAFLLSKYGTAFFWRLWERPREWPRTKLQAERSNQSVINKINILPIMSKLPGVSDASPPTDDFSRLMSSTFNFGLESSFLETTPDQVPAQAPEENSHLSQRMRLNGTTPIKYGWVFFCTSIFFRCLH